MKKKKRAFHEVSYWQSMADAMVALLLCILLVMMLLMMYLVRLDDNKIDDKLGYAYQQYDKPGDRENEEHRLDDEYGDHYYERDKYENSSGGGGGGGGGGDGGSGDDYGSDDHPYDDPDPGIGEGEGLERAAVLVQVMDGETQRTIKKEGITFELYNRDALLMELNNYYPKKITYKNYKTEKEGTFFLPERIVVGNYYLTCLTAIPGYDTGENTYFEIDKAYDWDDPFVVNVMLYPSKNAIEIQTRDSSDGTGVPGAAFQILAAENIITADGTLRYKEGVVVDTVRVDGSGMGRSKDLYLGNYTVRQLTVPEYYGKMEKELQVSLKSRTSTRQREKIDIYLPKTTVELTAMDDLYRTVYLSNTKYALRSDEGVLLKTYQANELGRITITNLKKNTTYRISQETVPKGYQLNPEELVFRVTAEGYVNGAARASLEMTSRIIRLSIGVQDILFHNMVSDVHIALLDSEDNVVRGWTTSGVEQTIEGLDPGDYKLVVGGNKDAAIHVKVEDQTELQRVLINHWTTTDIVSLVVAALVLAGLAWLLVWLRKRKKEKEGSEL